MEVASEHGSSNQESAEGDAQGEVSVASIRDITGICSERASGLSNGSSDQVPKVPEPALSPIHQNESINQALLTEVTTSAV